jgi:HD-GYP domain-containing protein (c-di-GMP phosphodiesterase class II)
VKYEKEWSIDDVLQYIKSESGTHFDPELVSALLANFDGTL